MSLPPLTTRQLTGALFGWLGTGFATWLLIPAWKEVLEQKPAPSTSSDTSLSFQLFPPVILSRSFFFSLDCNGPLLRTLACRSVLFRHDFKRCVRY